MLVHQRVLNDSNVHLRRVTKLVGSNSREGFRDASPCTRACDLSLKNGDRELHIELNDV